MISIKGYTTSFLYSTSYTTFNHSSINQPANGRTALAIGIEKGGLKVAEWLVTHGAQFDADAVQACLDLDNRTHICPAFLANALGGNFVRLLDAFFAAAPDVKVSNSIVLVEASQKRHLATLRRVLQNTSCTQFYYRALDIACKSLYFDVLDLFIENFKARGCPTDRIFTQLHARLVQLRIDAYRHDTYQREGDDLEPEEYDVLVEHATISYKTESLLTLAGTIDAVIIKDNWEKTSRAETCDNEGSLWIGHYPTIQEYLEACEETKCTPSLITRKLLALLVRHGQLENVNIDYKPYGNTAAHMAILFGDVTTLTLLHRQGANLSAERGSSQKVIRDFCAFLQTLSDNPGFHKTLQPAIRHGDMYATSRKCFEKKPSLQTLSAACFTLYHRQNVDCIDAASESLTSTGRCFDGKTPLALIKECPDPELARAFREAIAPKESDGDSVEPARKLGL